MKLKLGYPVKFKKAKLPAKKKIIGKYCFLEPVNVQKHSKDLFKNFSLDKKGIDWVYMPSGPFKDEASLKKYMKDKNLAGNPFFYSIYSKRLKTFCGLASYLRIKPKVYLMMKNVFDDLGYRRYEWKCDNLNKRSKKSALRLGFKFEGVFRQATIYKNRNRDTAWYSIIDKEWPNYKKKYLTYLKKSNFTEANKQRKKLTI